MLKLPLVSAPEIVVAREPYHVAIVDGRPLLQEHWRELAVYEDIPLDPEFEIYEALDAKGMLDIYTVRRSGELIAYAVYFTRRHHHYRHDVWSISDIIMVRKEYRNFGVGNALFDFLEKDMVMRGISVIHTTTKMMHPELAMLLESRGHEKVEVGFSKRL